METATDSEPRTVGVRLTAELAAALDAQVERLKLEYPGHTWTDAGVLRTAFIRYLKARAALLPPDLA